MENGLYSRPIKSLDTKINTLFNCLGEIIFLDHLPIIVDHTYRDNHTRGNLGRQIRKEERKIILKTFKNLLKLYSKIDEHLQEIPSWKRSWESKHRSKFESLITITQE